MKKILTMVALVLSACAAHADFDYVVQLAAWGDGQIPTYRNSTIYGARFSLIHGDCQRIYGLDMGFSGRARERAYGLQVAWGFNHVTDGAGVQLGVVNYVENEYDGLQVGFWNEAATFAGLQVGIVNKAEDLAGLQIGLVNIIENQPAWILPIVNVGF